MPRSHINCFIALLIKADFQGLESVQKSVRLANCNSYQRLEGKRLRGVCVKRRYDLIQVQLTSHLLRVLRQRLIFCARVFNKSGKSISAFTDCLHKYSRDHLASCKDRSIPWVVFIPGRFFSFWSFKSFPLSLKLMKRDEQVLLEDVMSFSLPWILIYINFPPTFTFLSKD